LYNEFGIRYRSGYFERYDTSFIRSYGFKVKSEIRYYLPRKIGVEKIRTVFSGPYLGANLFYIRDVHNSEIEYNPDKDTAVTASDDFGVSKNVIGLNLIIGIDKKITKSFSIDVYAGFGYRFRFIKNSFREFDPEKDTRVKPDGLAVRGFRDDIDVKTGFSATPGLTGGLRLGFSF
jgi:hypothetical protein